MTHIFTDAEAATYRRELAEIADDHESSAAAVIDAIVDYMQDVCWERIDSLRTQLEQAQQDAANLTTDLLQSEARETALRDELERRLGRGDRAALAEARALSGEGRP